jgi:hypothetical protein
MGADDETVRAKSEAGYKWLYTNQTELYIES